MNIVAVLTALHISVADIEWAKWVFAVAYIAATGFVALGVYWESDKFPKEKQHLGWRVLLIALAIETLSGGIVMALDSAIADVRSAETALAYINAANALDGIRETLSPRHLSNSALKRVRQKVCPLGPRPFIYAVTPAMEEGSDIHRQVGVLLIKDCKWAMRTPRGVLLRPGIALSLGSGVTIGYFSGNKEFKIAAEALVSALGDEGIASEVIPFDGSNPSDDKGVITVAIGTKPLLLRYLPTKFAPSSPEARW